MLWPRCGTMTYGISSRPGELVYVVQAPSQASAKGKSSISRTKQNHRVLRVAEAAPHTQRIDGHGFYRGRYCTVINGPQSDVLGSGFKVECYFLDLDGENFVPEWCTFTFLPFPGKAPIGCLLAYPLRFAESSQEIRSAGIATGREVLECIERKRMAFDGPCLLYEPNNQETLAFKGDPLREPERYDGEVYIERQGSHQNASVLVYL